MFVFEGKLQVTFPHLHDGVLGIIAVDDRDIETLYIVQVRSCQHREGGFTRSAFLEKATNFVFSFIVPCVFSYTIG